MEDKKKFWHLLNCVHANPKAIYTFIYPDGQEKDVTYRTDYETDNDREIDDPEYEEFWGIAFMDVTNGKLFEVTYHNLPMQILYEGKNVL